MIFLPSADFARQRLINQEHYHDKAQLTFMEKGVMQIQIGKSVYLIPENYALYIPKLVAHTSIKETGAKPIHIFFDINESMCNKKFADVIFIAPTELLKQLIFKLDTVDFHSSDYKPYYDLIYPEILASTADNPHLLTASNHPKLLKVIEYISTHLGEHLDLPLLAELVYITPRHLSRIFKAETGLSFSDWTSHYKMLMALTILPVKKSTTLVAQELGYDSDSAFIYMFKKRMNGKVPSDFYN
ncbi:AraC family transcriptional regulator [Cysteiniphilum halobium]|uniref:AraC family transcriptional regulator n=1 Tax=Cysteiniphilum halobium TaxID=2219059 RepID=UPI000E649663|nr:AraC family transcriptional regulator [Cysteiniphilum halobium]